MIKQIALRKLASIRKNANIDDGIGSWRDSFLEGDKFLANSRVDKIKAGSGWNPALENYTFKKNLIKKFKNNPSLLNKLKLKMFI